jgi:hypothetical protein
MKPVFLAAEANMIWVILAVHTLVSYTAVFAEHSIMLRMPSFETHIAIALLPDANLAAFCSAIAAETNATEHCAKEYINLIVAPVVICQKSECVFPSLGGTHTA